MAWANRAGARRYLPVLLTLYMGVTITLLAGTLFWRAELREAEIHTKNHVDDRARSI